jgi:hypothetical protein
MFYQAGLFVIQWILITHNQRYAFDPSDSSLIPPIVPPAGGCRAAVLQHPLTMLRTSAQDEADLN